MKSNISTHAGESPCPNGGPLRLKRISILGLAVLLQAASLHANAQTPASITSIPMPDFSGSLSFSARPVIDAAGNAYTAVSTASAQYVNPGAAQTIPGGGLCETGGFQTFVFPCTDVLLTKRNSAGTILYATLLGGPKDDVASAIAIDAPGNLYVTGGTTSSYVVSPAITPNISYFVAKLSPDGSRYIFLIYLPSNVAGTSSISADALGNAYIAATIGDDICVFKISSDGSQTLYAKTIGGTGRDSRPTLTTDQQGNVVLVGQTASIDFPVTAGALQSRLKGIQNTFLVRLDPSGNVIYSSYLGGSGEDLPRVVALDAAGNIYVAGATTSSDFPVTPGTMQTAPIVPSWGHSPGGYVAKLSPDGSQILYATYVRSFDTNNSRPGIEALSVTDAGDAYTTGSTSAGFPVTNSAPNVCVGPGVETFLAHLDSKGALLDATYLRASQMGQVLSLRAAIDSSVMFIAQGMTAQGLMAHLRFGDANTTPASCLSSAVLNGTTLYPDYNIAPGQFVSLTGFGIGPEQGIGFLLDDQGKAPGKLGGVEVLFDGAPAPVLYAQSRQVNAQVPFELQGRTSTTITLRYNGKQFDPITANVGPVAPGLFRRQPDVSAQALAINQDGTVNSPSSPAPVGSVVALWGAGFGPVDPACGTGVNNADVPIALSAGVVAGITGFTDSWPLQVRYQGGAPGLLCGVVQINVLIPAGTPTGTRFYSPSAQTNGPTSGLHEPIGAAISVR